MTRLRFNLAQSMAIVLLVGVGLAAARLGTVLWSSAVFTLTVAVLSAAILGAMARRGRARVTWAGFALFGWVYLGTAFGPGADSNGVNAPPFVTRWGLDYWDAKRWPGGMGRIDTAPPGEELFSRWPVPAVVLPDAFQIRRIGHCLAAILFGLVGAALGRLLAVKEEQPNP
jgi:hypothetical protein